MYKTEFCKWFYSRKLAILMKWDDSILGQNTPSKKRTQWNHNLSQKPKLVGFSDGLKFLDTEGVLLTIFNFLSCVARI